MGFLEGNSISKRSEINSQVCCPDQMRRRGWFCWVLPLKQQGRLSCSGLGSGLQGFVGLGLVDGEREMGRKLVLEEMGSKWWCRAWGSGCCSRRRKKEEEKEEDGSGLQVEKKKEKKERGGRLWSGLGQLKKEKK